MGQERHPTGDSCDWFMILNIRVAEKRLFLVILADARPMLFSGSET